MSRPSVRKYLYSCYLGGTGRGLTSSCSDDHLLKFTVMGSCCVGIVTSNETV